VLLVIVVLNHFANLFRVAKLDGISQFVMAYGGLRGAIAFSLAVVLDRRHFQSRQLFITTTIVVVYFTNIVLVGTWSRLDLCNRRLFKTNDFEIVTYCRKQFNLDMPSTVLKERSDSFAR